MSNSISFAFEGTPVRVISDDIFNPLFVAHDVAKALGYKKPENAIKRHCKRQTTTPKQGGGFLTVIPESDLYRLTLRSNLESAERFQDWVVEDVLPSIRKTGRYEYPYTVNPSDTLTLEQGDTLRDMLKDAVEKLPKDKKAAFMIKGWSKLRAHFKVGYRQIPQSEYAEALSIVSRHVVDALEGELLPPVEEVPPHIVMVPIDTRKDGQHLIVVSGGLVGKYLPTLTSDTQDYDKPWGTLLKARFDNR